MPPVTARTAVVLALVAGFAAAGRAEMKPLRLHPIEPVVNLESFQRLQADTKGNVLLLVENGYRVFRIAGNTKPVEVAALPVEDRATGPLRVALSPTGDVWIVNGRDGEVLRIEGKEVSSLTPLPPGVVRSLGFAGSSPVASVQRIGPPPAAGAIGPGGDPQALALVLSGGEWEPLITRERSSESARDSEMGGILDHCFAFAAGARGRLWVVNEYDYRVRLLSGMGKALLDLRVPEIRAPRHTPGAQEAFEKRVQEQRPQTHKVVRAVAVPERVIRAIASRGADLYVLWRRASDNEDELFLDVISTIGEVKRLALSIPQARVILSMAAGKRELFLGPARADQGLFRLPWDELDAAETWQPVTVELASVQDSGDDS